MPCLLTFSGNSKEIAKVRKLLGLARKQLESLKEPKKSIETVPDDLEVNFPEQWLSYNNIRLTVEDKAIIMTGEELTDKHIDFSTSLIKKDHTNISGLESTLILNYIKNPVVTPALHILHCRGNHWILVTNIGCTLGKVKVFDSIYFTLYQETLKLIYSIYGANVQVIVEKGPKQIGCKDCGLFSIATAIHLANGGDPTTIHFDQNSMRKHLIHCFESYKVTNFPTVQLARTIYC